VVAGGGPLSAELGPVSTLGETDADGVAAGGAVPADGAVAGGAETTIAADPSVTGPGAGLMKRMAITDALIKAVATPTPTTARTGNGLGDGGGEVATGRSPCGRGRGGSRPLA
jgi:hypothetical protein